MLHCEIPDVYDVNDNSYNNGEDSFSVSLVARPFRKKDEYHCPARDLSLFLKIDSEFQSIGKWDIYFAGPYSI